MLDRCYEPGLGAAMSIFDAWHIIPYNTIRSGRALLASAEAGQAFGGN